MAIMDTELHRTWVRNKDADAFTSIVRIHSEMVFGACRRVLRNDADAEEITQECFWKLARESRPVERSLAGWLHTVATRMSLNDVVALSANTSEQL